MSLSSAGVMKEWRTFSRFPCSASSYYALMLDGDFQARAHVRGLGMACYDVVDEPNDDGARLNRVVYSEPRLNLPAVLERVMKRAQAYHERAVFDLRDRSRFVRVVPCVGGESIDFMFHERVRPDEDGVGGCVVEAEVRVKVKGGWLGRILERFIRNTSKQKIAERDAWLNAHFRACGYDTFDGVARAEAAATPDAASSRCDSGGGRTEWTADDDRAPVSATVRLARSSAPAKTHAAAREESLSALLSHPLPPEPRRSMMVRVSSSFAKPRRRRDRAKRASAEA